jgi:hypothetical protein
MKYDECAGLIAALSQTTEMLSGLLDLLDRIVDVNEDGRRLTPADIARFREHARLWRAAR